MKQLYSLHKRAIKFLMSSPNMDYKSKVLCSQTSPSRRTTITQQMCSFAKGCSRQSPSVPEDLMIPSERLHVDKNKLLLPRTRIDIFKTSFSFSGPLAWNSLLHHLRYPMELKTFKRKAFQALAKPP